MLADEVLALTQMDEDWNFVMGAFKTLLIDVFSASIPQIKHTLKPVANVDIMDVGKKTIDQFNPYSIWTECKTAVKKYGWKVGLFIIVVEILDHVIMPAIFASLSMPIVSAAIPWSEALIYPIIYVFIRKFRKDKKESCGLLYGDN